MMPNLPLGRPKAVVLHLSDMHKTTDEPVSTSEILRWLLTDLTSYKEFGIPQPNVIVVSGDLVQSATEPEYTEFVSLLRGVMDHLRVNESSVVLVPGNHDINWELSDYELRVVKKDGRAVATVTAGDTILGFRDEASFAKRLDNFRSAFQQLKGRQYPVVRTEQFTLDVLDDAGIVFAGFSSCDQNHSRSRRASIHPDAIHAAANQIKPLIARGYTAVATWHHDLAWTTTEDDCLDAQSLSLLSTCGFALGLCGHTHRPAHHDAAILGGYQLPVVAAGSVCAGPRQRPESMPRSYNVLELYAGHARVWVRVKKDRNSPWRDCAEFGAPTRRRSWFEVSFSTATPSREGAIEASILAATPLQPASTSMLTARPAPPLQARTPFGGENAKLQRREQVIDDYVWISAANDLLSPKPQIVLGTRGAGKTALLLTQTIDFQLRRPDLSEAALRTVGLYCAMKLDDVTAFTGKGHIPQTERKNAFAAAVATMWACELCRSLRYWLREEPDREMAQDSSKLIVSASECLGYPLKSKLSASEQLVAAELGMRNIRNQLIASLAIQDLRARNDQIALAMTASSATRAPVSTLAAIAAILDEIPRFRGTVWSVLFDEVEFLNSWQQAVLYQYIASPVPRVTAKLATLPYAHTRALAAVPTVLVEKHDYSIVTLAPPDQRTSKTTSHDHQFMLVANGIWDRRLLSANLPHTSLESVWPSAEFQDALEAYGGHYVSTATMHEHFLRDLSTERAQSARKALAQSKRRWSDQYWRKFREPFKFRLARRAGQNGVKVPLYWGYRQMLRACGNNPRQLLMLLDQCWVDHWAQDGMRPLSPMEQFDSLRSWASGFTRICSSLPHRGVELTAILERVARRLTDALYGPKKIAGERLTVAIEECTTEQAEAIAIAIAYGFLVPRVSMDYMEESAFPTENLKLGLGYPVAVDNLLPLRTGEVLAMKSLRQLELPWLED